MTGTEFNNEEFEEYIKDSNEEYADYVKSGAKEFHSAFDELKIQKVTKIWELTYNLCVINNSEEDIKQHSEVMLKLNKTELNRIQNMKIELGTNDLNSNKNYVASSSVINKLINLFKKIFCEPYIQSNSNNKNKKMSFDKALQGIATIYSENVYTYNAYASFAEDNTRNGISQENFGARFGFDLGRASAKAKEKRTENVDKYNAEHPESPYNHLNFVDSNSYNLDLETFIGDAGIHAKYNCKEYENITGNEFICDDCSSFAGAMIDYMTYGIVSKKLNEKREGEEAVRIYNIGKGNILRGKYWEAMSELGFTQHSIDDNTLVSEFDNGVLLLKSYNTSHYEFVFKDKADGKYKRFGWGMVKKAFNPLECLVSSSKVKKNDVFNDYQFYIKLQ